MRNIFGSLISVGRAAGPVSGGPVESPFDLEPKHISGLICFGIWFAGCGGEEMGGKEAEAFEGGKVGG